MGDIEFEIFLQIKTIIDDELLVIVEGNNDRESLESLGIKRIITLNKKPLYSIIEAISHQHKEVVILTDLDSEGRKLYRILYNELTSRGLKVNDRLRNLLFKTKLSHIEGLAGYLERNYKT